jgi:hypothetical protein
MNGSVDEWTPAIGWRIVLIRILWAAGASMVLTLGTSVMVTRFFGNVGVDPTKRLPSYGVATTGRFSASVAVAVGAVAGVMASWSLVEKSSIMGAPLLGAVVAGLGLADLAAWQLGVLLLGAAWGSHILFISIMAFGTALIVSTFRILADS